MPGFLGAPTKGMKNLAVSMPRSRLGEAQSGIGSMASEVSKELRFWLLRTWLFPQKRLDSSVPRLLCDWSIIPLRYPVFPLCDIT